MKRLSYLLLLAACLVTHVSAKEELRVFDIRATATLPGAMTSVAYMRITSPAPLKLVNVESPLAGVAEIHSMEMYDGIMSMRAVDALEIPANKLVELKPGGFHIMLMQLKQPLKAGAHVPLVLTFQNANGKRHTVEVNATAQARESMEHAH
jgi:periplasmic copper chaperone A